MIKSDMETYTHLSELKKGGDYKYYRYTSPGFYDSVKYRYLNVCTGPLFTTYQTCINVIFVIEFTLMSREVSVG